MKINFTKMQGCGNDYVYINGFTEKVPLEKKPDFVRRMSDRHFGIGGDGVIFVNPSSLADFEMEMYNADGTRAEMCGNGIRCVAKFVYDKGLTDKTEITVESFGQVKYLRLFTENGRVKQVRVDMGEPVLRAEEIPVVCDGEQAVAEAIEVEGRSYEMTCVSMGNPHAVVYMEDVAGLEIEKTGPFFENHPRFPRRDEYGIREGFGQEYGGNACLGARLRGDAGLRDGLLRCGCGLRVKWADGETGDGQGPGRGTEIEWDEKNNRVYDDRACGDGV